MSGAPADHAKLAGTILERKYRIDEPVAEGGFGVVYAGHHLSLDVPVAVKILKQDRAGADDDWTDRVTAFLEEARMLARLRHPNIVAALDSGIVHVEALGLDVPWVVLEWLEGKTLRDELSTRRGQGGRTPAECMRLLRPVLEAIAAAHDAGVVHRDIKPSNVMLVPDGHGGVTPRVLDFGVAKVMRPDESQVETPPSGDTATRSGGGGFTVASAAPEQLSGTRTGPWTDVFALGLLLVEVLVDRAPLRVEDPNDRLRAVFGADRPTPARFGVDVGPWEGVLARALAVRPGDRQQNASELLRELDAAEPARAARWPRVAGVSLLVAASAAGAVFGASRALRHPAAPAASASSSASSASAAPVRAFVGRPTGIETSNTEAAVELLAGGAKLLVAKPTSLRVTTLADGSFVDLAPPPPITQILGAAALPDGERIVLYGTAGTDEGLWLASLDGSPSRKLRDGTYSGVRVSPDGRRVAFENHGIYVAPLEGGEPRLVVRWSEAPGEPVFEWSPDGTRLAVVVPSQEGAHLDIVDASTGAPQRLLNDARLGESALLWSARYGLLAALQPKGAERAAELVRVPLDGSPDATPPVVFTARNRSLDLMRESGERVVVLEGGRDFTLQFAELDASGRHLASGPTTTPVDPSSRIPIAYTERGVVMVYDAGRVLAVFREDGEQDRLVATGPDEWISFVASRGTASMIVELYNKEGSCRLEEVSLTGETRAIGRGQLGCDVQLQCPRVEGAPCVARGPRKSEYAYWTFDPSTGHVGPPFHTVAVAFQPWRLSPDGRSIVYTDLHASSRLQEVRVGDGVERTIDVGVPHLQWVEVAPDGKPFLLTVNNIDQFGASKLLAATRDGHADVLWEGEVGAYVAAPVLALDGRRFAFFYARYWGEIAFLEPVAADAAGQ